MSKRLKIQDLDYFQDDLAQESTPELSEIQGGMVALSETSDSLKAESAELQASDELLVRPLPWNPDPLPWYPDPCCCYPFPYPYPQKPTKPLPWDGEEITAIQIFPCYCPVIL